MNGWRDRLRQAVETSGKSMREVSIAAGRAPNYVYCILEEDKDPTIDNLLGVIRAIGASPSWIVAGVDLSADDEQRFKAFVDLEKSQQMAVLQLAEAFRRPSH